MPIYKYEAKKGPQEVICDTMEAESTDEVVKHLTNQGCFPLKVEPVMGFKDKEGRRGTFTGSVRVRDLNVFTRQLASLIKSGVPLLKALNVILDQTEHPILKNIISEVASEVKDGHIFSEALARYPTIFPPLYISLIKAGEDSGTLENVLVRLTAHRERMEEIKSRIRSALVYPVIILMVGILTIVFLITFVVPQLKAVFSSIGQSLPFYTQALLNISGFFQDYWYLLIGGILLLLLIGRGVIIIERMVFDDLKLHLPVVGNFFQKSELGKFCRTLSLLINNGIPILYAMEITTTTLSNVVLRREFRKITEDLKSGNTFSRGLRQSGKRFFPPFMVNLIAVGEESGRLSETLGEIADSYERETEEIIKIGLSLVEPVLILVMGAIVGFIVISMLAPIFTMGTLIQ